MQGTLRMAFRGRPWLQMFAEGAVLRVGEYPFFRYIHRLQRGP